MGAMARQGPHHVAQKSTSTGLSDLRTSWSKFASVTSTIPLPAISFSPLCNVALFGGCSHVSETTSSRGRDPDDLNRNDSINSCPNRGQPIMVTLTFDAWGGAKVAKRSRGVEHLRDGRGVIPGNQLLEDELNRCLHQTGWGRADNLSERRAVDIAVHGCWSVELGVVEQVEPLEAELQRLGFSERNTFQQGHVVVVDARSVKEAALGVAGLS